MRKILFILILISAGGFLNSCNTLIDPDFDNRRSMDLLLSDPGNAEGILLEAYNALPNSYNFDIDAATDDAVTNNKNSNYRRMASDGWLVTSSPVSKWGNYDQIYNVNLFLENVDKIIWPSTPNLNAADQKRFALLHTKRLRGEAFALRAWYQWQLLQAHAGVAANDALLGIPIIIKTLKTSDNLNIPRGTFDQCVTQINADCDSAIINLPLRYADITNDFVYNATTGVRYTNRLNGAIAKAIKAKVALYAASPAYNPTGDNNRWITAATLAGGLLTDLGGSALKISPSGHIFYTKAYNNADIVIEGIWRRDKTTNQSGYEKANFPPSKEGNGNINPSQNLVNAFPDKNGYPISQSTVYSSAKPYDNRDPRLTQYIVYNANPSRLIYTYQGAIKDGINASEFATRTGYYLRKFVNEGVSIVGTKITGVDRFFLPIRHTDLLLIYAEAANEAFGPDGNPVGVGFSARNVIDAIRTRAGISNQYAATLTTKDDFRKLIQNERRIELCFEGERFWDIRRWKLIDVMKQSADGMLVTTADGGVTYTFSLLPNVENRVYKDNMIYAPIPYNEILKYSLLQNKGW